MPQAPGEVFTLDELAIAAGVSRHLANEHAKAGDIRFIPGTRFLVWSAAIDAGRRLRVVAIETTAIAEAPLFETRLNGAFIGDRRRALPAFASSFIHASLMALVLWATAAPARTSAEPTGDHVRFVFVLTPGPGGGGGGGGNRSSLQAPRIEHRGSDRADIAVPNVTPEKVLTSRRIEEPPPRRAPSPLPKPIEREPDPLPSSMLIAPVASAATSAIDRKGVVEDPRGEADNQGPGVSGGVGTGRGEGNGNGLGSGIGDGAGGGTGGGPYHPGSGIEPPRLLREIKADYTDDARRRGITGEVILEIVVQRDGTVGTISLLKSVGAGLDQRAIAAVKQWQFSPARKQGEPVDVIVQVAVEFNLR